MNILIAEDDARTREGLRLALVRAGHRVITAADGEAAVKLFAEEDPDIVCLDIMMPKMSGYDVCKNIRRADKRVPVLFLSAKSEEVDRVLGLELGADDFLSKPFGVPELLARIADLSDILARAERLREVVRDELIAIRDEYGDARRTEINRDFEDAGLGCEDVVFSIGSLGDDRGRFA